MSTCPLKKNVDSYTYNVMKRIRVCVPILVSINSNITKDHNVNKITQKVNKASLISFKEIYQFRSKLTNK